MVAKIINTTFISHWLCDKFLESFFFDHYRQMVVIWDISALHVFCSPVNIGCFFSLHTHSCSSIVGSICVGLPYVYFQERSILPPFKYHYNPNRFFSHVLLLPSVFIWLNFRKFQNSTKVFHVDGIESKAKLYEIRRAVLLETHKLNGFTILYSIYSMQWEIRVWHKRTNDIGQFHTCIKLIEIKIDKYHKYCLFFFRYSW